MARSSGPDNKATVKESDSSSNSSSGSGNDTDDSSDDNVEDDDSSVVPGLLDVRIHISSNGKMRKAPQIAELKPDPKQKKRGILMFYSSNIYIIIDNCH